MCWTQMLVFAYRENPLCRLLAYAPYARARLQYPPDSAFISRVFHCNKEANEGLIKCAQGFQFIEHPLYAQCLCLWFDYCKASEATKILEEYFFFFLRLYP